MALDQITAELESGILTITLNRPDRLNAWTQQMASELMETFDRVDADDEVRVVIVTGAGRAFCAGADLEKGGETFDARARQSDYAGGSAAGLHRDNGGMFTPRVFPCTKPVIAAVNGGPGRVGSTLTPPLGSPE